MPKQGVSILLADNSLPEIKLIKSSLSEIKDLRYNIDIAKTGKDTLLKVARNKFDLLLMNQNLPGIKGIEMLQQISEKKLGMPVIMIVADGDEKLGVQAIDRGAYDYITSDEIKTSSLSRAVRRAIQRKKLENEIRESLTRLEKLAIRDGLTGLYNHHHFAEVIKNDYKKAKRHLQSLSCIMMDLDHFKSVNDNNGHQFGDYVLVESANILNDLVRDTDFVARYGGEEFFIILPNTDLDGAFILAERIRASFESNVFKKGSSSETVTVSIGVSSTSDDNVYSHDDLIANADKSLYHAKWRGRNNVCTFEEYEQGDKGFRKEETEKIETFYRHLNTVKENIKENCIESALEILCRIEQGWDYINKHSVRVSNYVERLAVELPVADDDTRVIKRAALLHDIGMVGVNSEILKKKGKLTKDEFSAIKRHTNIGVRMMEKTKLFEKELPIILYHHERFDGTGYPHKLKGDKIPIGARILAVAESYDVMRADTVYRKAHSSSRALNELKECSGTQFDPAIVKAFVKAIEKETA